MTSQYSVTINISIKYPEGLFTYIDSVITLINLVRKARVCPISDMEVKILSSKVILVEVTHR